MEFTLSTGEAARALGVTPHAVRLMAKRGELAYQERARGVRTVWYYDAAEVEALRRRRAGEQEP